MKKTLTREQFNELSKLTIPSEVEKFKLFKEALSRDGTESYFVIEVDFSNATTVVIKTRRSDYWETIYLDRLVIPETETGKILVDRMEKFLESINNN